MRSVSSMDMSDSFIEAFGNNSKAKILRFCPRILDDLTQFDKMPRQLGFTYPNKHPKHQPVCGICFHLSVLQFKQRFGTTKNTEPSEYFCDNLVNTWMIEAESLEREHSNSIIVLGQRPNPSHPSHLRQSGNSFSDPNTIICRARSTLVAESSNKPKEYPQIALGTGRARCNHSANSL